MNTRRQEKCISWAAWDGQEKVKQQWCSGDPFFIRKDDAKAAAQPQAQQRANDYAKTFDITIPPEEYPEWEQIYTSAYIIAYLTALPEWQRCRQCGKDDLPTNQDTHLCVRCLIDNEAKKKASA